MASIDTVLPPPAPPAAEPEAAAVAAGGRESTAGQVSQWTLMRWRFVQNRLSVAALVLLVVMYGVAALAPFFSPYSPQELDATMTYAAPTKVHWIGGRPAVCPLVQTLDTHNFKWEYAEDCSKARPIELFVPGFEYRFLGLFKTNVHLFGVTAGPPLPGAPAATPVPAAGAGAAANDPLAPFRATPQPAPGTTTQPGAAAPPANDPLAPFRATPQPGAAPPPATAGGAAQQAERPPKLYLFGADQQGRDLFSRILEGSRVSLTIGIVGVVLSVVIGSILGATSGYLGGPADNIIQRLIEIIRSMPTLPLWAAIAAALPRTTTVVQRYFLITVVISLVAWTGLARELRGKVLAYRTLDYIAAARLAGNSHLRIILTHMLPNAASHIIVVATIAVPIAILSETTLSFLGLGMLPPAVSWGVLLKDAQQIDSVLLHPWMLIPGIPVIIAVACYFLLGDGLRDAIDPYS
jgi:ABC-type dipeptide/oligopeptide/nickel transport system permease subunit